MLARAGIQLGAGNSPPVLFDTIGETPGLAPEAHWRPRGMGLTVFGSEGRKEPCSCSKTRGSVLSTHGSAHCKSSLLNMLSWRCEKFCPLAWCATTPTLAQCYPWQTTLYSCLAIGGRPETELITSRGGCFLGCDCGAALMCVSQRFAKRLASLCSTASTQATLRNKVVADPEAAATLLEGLREYVRDTFRVRSAHARPFEELHLCPSCLTVLTYVVWGSICFVFLLFKGPGRSSE